jgi:hypothetical protein
LASWQVESVGNGEDDDDKYLIMVQGSGSAGPKQGDVEGKVSSPIQEKTMCPDLYLVGLWEWGRKSDFR